MSKLKDVMLVDHWQFNKNKDGEFEKISFWLDNSIYTAKIQGSLRVATLNDNYTKTNDKLAYLVAVNIKDKDTGKHKKVHLLCPLSLKIQDTPEPNRVMDPKLYYHPRQYSFFFFF